MKTLTEYLNEAGEVKPAEPVNESKTADFLQTVVDCIEDRENVTMEDAKRLVIAIKDIYGKDITEDEAFGTCEMVAKEWADLF